MARQDAISAYEAKAAGDLSFLSGPRDSCGLTALFAQGTNDNDRFQ